MRRFAGWLVLPLSLVAVASADESFPPSAADSVAVPRIPATGALSYRATLSSQSEHSCSQSFASTSWSGTVTVTVDKGGAARVRLEASRLYTSGSARGRYSPGEKAERISRTESSVRRAWSGPARRGDETLSLALTGDDDKAPLTLECAVRPVEVVQPREGKEERPARLTRVLSCVPAAQGKLPEPLSDLLRDGGLLVGAGPGLRLQRHKMGYGGHEVHVGRELAQR